MFEIQLLGPVHVAHALDALHQITYAIILLEYPAENLRHVRLRHLHLHLHLHRHQNEIHLAYCYLLFASCRRFVVYFGQIMLRKHYSVLGIFACFLLYYHFCQDDVTSTFYDKLSLFRLHSPFHPPLIFYNNLYLYRYYCHPYSYAQNRRH